MERWCPPASLNGVTTLKTNYLNFIYSMSPLSVLCELRCLSRYSEWERVGTQRVGIQGWEYKGGNT